MITTERGLLDLCERIKRAGRFALDFEFTSERTYYARLDLAQIAVENGDGEDLVLIDPMELGRPMPLYELIAAPEIETILHAGSQDMEIVYNESGLVPRNVFDTQIGAALTGFGDQPGYANLVEGLTGVRLAKLETRTDWQRRPLSAGQIDYALDDVRYLHGMRDSIGEKLESLGRIDWARDEMSHYEEQGNYEKDLSRLYLKIGRIRRLSSRELAVVRELAAWREEEAMRRDEPRGRVITDNVLVDVARKFPSHVSDLESMRGLHAGEIKRCGRALVDAVSRALSLPQDEWPQPPKGRGGSSEQQAVVELMDVFLRQRAREADIGPSYLGTTSQLIQLVVWLRGGMDGEPPRLMRGWRRTLVGDDLIALATGKLALFVDPEKPGVNTAPR